MAPTPGETGDVAQHGAENATERASLGELFDATKKAINERTDISADEKAGRLTRLETLRQRYEKDGLEVVLDTSREVASFRDALEFAAGALTTEGEFAGKSPDDMGRVIDSMLRKEKVEERINGLTAAGVETVADLSQLSVEQLMELEGRHEGILLYAFSDFVDPSMSIDVGAFDAIYRNPTPGEQIQIDFRGNDAAYRQIGASDILPPSVRCITVYSDGDRKRARTSVVRKDLKGRNQAGEGFFDERGYIPVYTGDVVVIGGEKEPEKGVAKDFDSKFRKPDGSYDYEAYEQSDEYAAAAQYVDNLPPWVGRTKELTPEDIDEFTKTPEAQGAAKSVIEAVNGVLKAKPAVTGEHCWDWCHKVYERAGVRIGLEEKWLDYPGRDCGDKHAPAERLDSLRPGDWIYVNNRNGSDKRGNHSVIFMGWVDRGKNVAKTASCPGSGKSGHAEVRDFDEQPITYIARPIPTGETAPHVA